jgi:hypothetical protein
VLPKDFQPEAYFENAFGIIVDDEVKPCVVKIKAFGNKSNYFRTLPLHPSQVEIETTQIYAVFSYFIALTFDFKQEILSHGEEVEVISPVWFRKEIADAVKEMHKLYG